MIVSFADNETAAVFEGKRVRRWAQLLAIVQRKLQLLDSAATLEALRGDRAGQHSIRINDQFRVCFVWRADGVHDVQIVDYH